MQAFQRFTRTSKQESQKQSKTLFLPQSATFQTRPPQLPLHLGLTLDLPKTFCPSLTHSSLTHHTSHYSTVRGQSEGVWGGSVCVCLCVIGDGAHQCPTTGPSSPLAGSPINWIRCTLKPEHLIFLWRKLEWILSDAVMRSVCELNTSVKWHDLAEDLPLWLSCIDGQISEYVNNVIMSCYVSKWLTVDYHLQECNIF